MAFLTHVVRRIMLERDSHLFDSLTLSGTRPAEGQTAQLVCLLELLERLVRGGGTVLVVAVLRRRGVRVGGIPVIPVVGGSVLH